MSGGCGTEAVDDPELRGAETGPPPAAAATLAAKSAAVRRARTVVEEFALAHGLDAEVIGSVMLAVSEAATNAVVHGFVDREPGVIRVECRAGVDELLVRVVDNGRGMQPRTDSPGLGVGLPTMGQLSESLDIRAAPGGGTEVCMTFAVSGLQGAAEPEESLSGEQMRLLVAVDRLTAGSGWPEEGVAALVELLCPSASPTCAWSTWWRRAKRHAGSLSYAALDQLATQMVEVTDDLRRASATDADDLATMRRLPVRWWVTVPLRRDDAARGLLHLAVSRTGGGRGGRSWPSTS